MAVMQVRTVMGTCALDTCGKTFSYEYRGGPYRRTCCDDHKRIWDNYRRKVSRQRSTENGSRHGSHQDRQQDEPEPQSRVDEMNAVRDALDRGALTRCSVQVDTESVTVQLVFSDLGTKTRATLTDAYVRGVDVPDSKLDRAIGALVRKLEKFREWRREWIGGPGARRGRRVVSPRLLWQGGNCGWKDLMDSEDRIAAVPLEYDGREYTSFPAMTTQDRKAARQWFSSHLDLTVEAPDTGRTSPDIGKVIR